MTYNQTVIYLIQSASSLPESYSYIKSKGNFLLLSFQGKSLDTDIFYPGSTWTQGRNALFNLAKNRKESAKYFCFLDDDLSFEGKSIKEGLSEFESFLDESEISIVTPDHWGYNSREWKIDLPKHLQRIPIYNSHFAAQTVSWFDGAMNAFHTNAIDKLLPYCEESDHICWWSSQYYLIQKANLYCRNSIVQYNNLYALNEQHSTYPKSLDDFAEVLGRFIENENLRFDEHRLSDTVAVYMLADLNNIYNNIRCLYGVDRVCAIARSLLAGYKKIIMIHFGPDQMQLSNSFDSWPTEVVSFNIDSLAENLIVHTAILYNEIIHLLSINTQIEGFEQIFATDQKSIEKVLFLTIINPAESGASCYIGSTNHQKYLTTLVNKYLLQFSFRKIYSDNRVTLFYNSSLIPQNIETIFR